MSYRPLALPGAFLISSFHELALPGHASATRRRRTLNYDKDAEGAAGGGGGEDADIDDDYASNAWAATPWARTAIAIKRVRATLQFEDEGQDARSRMAKELSALAEVGFARMVRPHLPQPVVEDLYQR